MSSREPDATYDLRLWITGADADTRNAALTAFVAEARELAEAHPRVSVRWIARRLDREGRPRIRRPRRAA